MKRNGKVPLHLRCVFLRLNWPRQKSCLCARSSSIRTGLCATGISVNTPQTQARRGFRRHREKSKKATETDETFQERSCNALEQNRTDTEQIKNIPLPPQAGSGFDARRSSCLLGLTWWIGKAGLQTARLGRSRSQRRAHAASSSNWLTTVADGHQPADVIANSIAGATKGYSAARTNSSKLAIQGAVNGGLECRTW